MRALRSMLGKVSILSRTYQLTLAFHKWSKVGSVLGSSCYKFCTPYLRYNPVNHVSTSYLRCGRLSGPRALHIALSQLRDSTYLRGKDRRCKTHRRNYVPQHQVWVGWKSNRRALLATVRKFSGILREDVLLLSGECVGQSR